MQERGPESRVVSMLLALFSSLARDTYYKQQNRQLIEAKAIEQSGLHLQDVYTKERNLSFNDLP
jgi:hypothetical protein